MNSNQAKLPYLQAIKTRIQEAFPNSKVTVWMEDSVVFLFPGHFTIKCRVDDCGASMETMDEIMDTIGSAEYYSDILIEKIKEVF